MLFPAFNLDDSDEVYQNKRQLLLSWMLNYELSEKAPPPSDDERLAMAAFRETIAVTNDIASARSG